MYKSLHSCWYAYALNFDVGAKLEYSGHRITDSVRWLHFKEIYLLEKTRRKLK